MGKKVKFDPNQPFTPVAEDEPKFDPNQPFEPVKKKEFTDVGPQQEQPSNLSGIQLPAQEPQSETSSPIAEAYSEQPTLQQDLDKARNDHEVASQGGVVTPDKSDAFPPLFGVHEGIMLKDFAVNLAKRAASVVMHDIPRALHTEKINSKTFDEKIFDEAKSRNPYVSEEAAIKGYKDRVGASKYATEKEVHDQNREVEIKKAFPEAKRIRNEQAEFLKDIPQSFHDTHSVGDFMKYLGGAGGQALGTGATSIATLGTAGYHLEKQDAYEEALNGEADRLKKSPQEVALSGQDKVAKEISQKVGVINAGLDAISLGSLVGNIPKKLTGMFVKAMVKKGVSSKVIATLEKVTANKAANAAIGGIGQTLVGAGTEMAQEANTISAGKISSGEASGLADAWRKMTPKDMDQIIEAGIQGGLGEGLIGGAHAAITTNKTTDSATPKTPEGDLGKQTTPDNESSKTEPAAPSVSEPEAIEPVKKVEPGTDEPAPGVQQPEQQAPTAEGETKVENPKEENQPLNNTQNEIGNNQESEPSGQGIETNGEHQVNTLEEGAEPTGSGIKNRDGSEEKVKEDFSKLTDKEEIARRYDEEARNPSVTANESAIASTLSNSKVNNESVKRFGDKNSIGSSIAKSYIKKGGQGIDQIAKDASLSLTEGKDDTAVTPDQVWEFMKRYPNGPSTMTTPAGNPILKALNERHIDVAGKTLNRASARAIVKRASENVSKLPKGEEQLNSALNSFIKDGQIDYQKAKEQINGPSEDFFKSAYGLNDGEFQKLKDHVNEQSEKPTSVRGDNPGSAEQTVEEGNGSEHSPESIERKIRSLRSTENHEERQKIAKEIHESTGKYLLNREGILVDDNGSFADRSSDTFFNLMDEGKAVYLLDKGAKIAESKEDYEEINNVVDFLKDKKIPLVDGAMMFDDAFAGGAIEAAKELGFDAIRLREIDGTAGTVHVLNLKKLTHIIGEDFVNKNTNEIRANIQGGGGERAVHLQNQEGPSVRETGETGSGEVGERISQEESEGNKTPTVDETNTAAGINTLSNQESIPTGTSEEKTNTQKVAEAREKFKDRLKSVKQKYSELTADVLSIVQDPKERARKHYELHRELVGLAKDAINVGITTVREFADVMDRKLDDFISRAFLDAQNEIEGKPLAVKDEDFFGERISGIKKALAPKEDIDETDIDRRTISQMVDRGKELVEKGEINPEAIVNEIVEHGGRALQPDEVASLVHYKVSLDNDFDSLNDKIVEEMQGENDPIKIMKLRYELEGMYKKLNDYHEMSIRTAYEQSLAFRLRKMLLNKEYNLASQIQKYKAVNNGEISEEILKKFRDLDKELKDVNQKLSDLEKKVREGNLKDAVENIQKDVDKERKRKPSQNKGKSLINEGISDLKSILNSSSFNIVSDSKSEAKRLLAQDKKIIEALGKIGKGLIQEGLATIENVGSKIKAYIDEHAKGKIDFDKYQTEVVNQLKFNGSVPRIKEGKLKIPKSLIRDLVDGGITDITELVDTLHGMLKDAIPGATITHRDVRDSITDYGKTLSMSKDEVDVKIREMRRVGKLLSGLEDVQAKKRPLRSGLQRDKVTDTERQLWRDIKEGLKEIPIEEGDPDQQWKTAIEGIKSRLKNQIADLESQIETGKKTPKKEKVAYDEEAKTLAEKRDQLRDIIQTLEGKPEISLEKRINLAIAGAERSLNDYERRIKESDFSKKAAPTKLESERLNALREQRDVAKQTYEQLKEDTGVAEKERLQKYKENTQKAIAEYQRRINEKDFVAKKKAQIVTDPEADRLELEKEKIKYEFDAAQEKNRLDNRSKSDKAKDMIMDAWNLPKGVLSSMDLSAVGRQGLSLGVAHPIIASRTFVEMLKQAASQERADTWLLKLKQSDIYPLIRSSKLYIADSNARLSAKEEVFQTNLMKLLATKAAKIPVLGKTLEIMLQGGERAYTGYLNKLRVDVFMQGVDQLKDRGITPHGNPEAYKRWADFVNNSSGRGDLGSLERAAPILNGLFFSPRFFASRINMLNPVKYAKMYKADPFVARMAAKDTLAYIGFGVLTLTLLHASGVDVDYDPNSPEFGMIRVGDRKFDIWAGLRPAVKVAMALTTRQKRNLRTGQLEQLNGERDGMHENATRADIALRFLRSKLSPGAGTLADFMTGKDFSGQETTVGGEITKNLIPLPIQDIYALGGDKTIGTGEFIASGLPAFFGFGMQNYHTDPETITQRFHRLQRERTKPFRDSMKRLKEASKRIDFADFHTRILHVTPPDTVFAVSCFTMKTHIFVSLILIVSMTFLGVSAKRYFKSVRKREEEKIKNYYDPQ